MKIKILSIVAPPDAVSTAQLVGEIADDLKAAGHDVSLLSTEPHYNHDGQALEGQPITWTRIGVSGQSCIGAVPVTHVRMSKKSGSKVGRLAQWLRFHAVAAAKIARSDADSVLVVSPPPTLALVARMRLARPRRRVVLAVWELYPDILVSLGHVDGNGITLRALRMLEGFTYRLCDHIAFLTPNMQRTAIRNHPFISSRSSVVPTWADTATLCPQPRPTPLRLELDLAEHFVVGYGGNIGPAQDLTSLVEAARILERSHQRISFVICGDGTMSRALRELAAGLRNVHFTGQLSFDRVPEMYSTFDVSVVALADGVAEEALPSKLYRSLACGVPILGIASVGSPLEQIVSRLRVGRASPPSSASALAEVIVAMAEDPDHSDIANHARVVAVDNFDRREITGEFVRLLQDSH